MYTKVEKSPRRLFKARSNQSIRGIVGRFLMSRSTSGFDWLFGSVLTFLDATALCRD